MLFLAFLLMTQFLGSGCVVGAVFATTVRTFPQHRGLITGLIKGWVGLCGGMITQIFVGVVWGLDLDDQEDGAWLSFTLVAGVIVIFATLVPSRILGKNAEREEEAEGPEFDGQVRRRVKTGYIILVAMGVFVVWSALMEKFVPHCECGRNGATTALSLKSENYPRRYTLVAALIETLVSLLPS